MPTPEDLDERLAGVLATLYLLFNEGYLAGEDGGPTRRDVAEEAAWLAQLVVDLFACEPEPLGLLALMRLQLARGQSRFDAMGELVLLPVQDRSLWNRSQIADSVRLIERAASFARPGPYQIQAAIVACHAEVATWEATGWPQILVLYDTLLAVAPSPVVRLNRAIALWQLAGPAAALEDIRALATALGSSHLFHATRAQLLRELDSRTEARDAERRALELTRNPAERSLLRNRLSEQSAATQ